MKKYIIPLIIVIIIILMNKFMNPDTPTQKTNPKASKVNIDSTCSQSIHLSTDDKREALDPFSINN